VKYRRRRYTKFLISFLFETFYSGFRPFLSDVGLPANFNAHLCSLKSYRFGLQFVLGISHFLPHLVATSIIKMPMEQTANKAFRFLWKVFVFRSHLRVYRVSISLFVTKSFHFQCASKANFRQKWSTFLKQDLQNFAYSVQSGADLEQFIDTPFVSERILTAVAS
jgi:hypothetical protein